jgi:hypothetical protein
MAKRTLVPNYNDKLTFDNGLLADDDINFVDHGPASILDIELAINEVDPSIKSNLNFRSPDAFKMMIMSSGLEEVRVILHYQMMQKQALIVATRVNQALMDTHLRALRELAMIKQEKALPNMVINLNCLYDAKTIDGPDTKFYSTIKSRFSQNL